MTVIIDYGVGNLFSLEQAFKAIGEPVKISSSVQEITNAPRLVLPGVGAFKNAAAQLRACGLWDLILARANAGVPILGICLGMQLLFEKSHEFGESEGLALLPGEIRPIAERVPKTLKIPQIGWNRLKLQGNSELFKYIKDDDFVYFVHSYYADCSPENLIATTSYGVPLTAAVQKGSICGCQFHPEKSGAVGLAILRGFLSLS